MSRQSAGLAVRLANIALSECRGFMGLIDTVLIRKNIADRLERELVDEAKRVSGKVNRKRPRGFRGLREWKQSSVAR